MNFKNFFVIFSIFMVLICCASAISAVSDDVINDTVSETYSGEDFVSVVNDEQVTEVDDSSSALDTSKNNDKLMSVQEDEKLSKTYNNSTFDELVVGDDDIVSDCIIGTLTVNGSNVNIFNNTISNGLIINGLNCNVYSNSIAGNVTIANHSKIYDNNFTGESMVVGDNCEIYGNELNIKSAGNQNTISLIIGNNTIFYNNFYASGQTMSIGGNSTIYNNNINNRLKVDGGRSKIYNNTCNRIWCVGDNVTLWSNSVSNDISIDGSKYDIYNNTGSISITGSNCSNCIVYGNNLGSLTVNGDYEGTIIHDNIITSRCYLYGGYVGSNSIVYNNVIKTLGFSSANSNNILLFNNTIEQINSLNNAKNVTLVNNIITSYFGDMKSNTNVTIVNNTIMHYGTANFIRIVTSTNVDVKNNFVYYYKQNKVYAFGNAALFGSGTNVTIEDNYPLSPNLVVDVNDFYIGTTQQLIVTMDENATGTVEIMFNGQKQKINMNKGTGRFTISPYLTAIGKHKVTVIFNPDSGSLYGPTEVSKDINVYRNDLPLNMTIENATIGGDAIIDVVIPNKAAQYGSIPNILLVIDDEEHVVNFGARYIDGVRDWGSLLATYTINNISSGNHSVIAIFEGNDKANAAHEIQTFTLIKSNSTVDVSYGAPVIGEDLVLNISVANVTGQVAVQFDDADEVFVDLVNGSANYTIEKIAAGKHYITVTYNGDAANNGAIFSDSFTLDKATPSVDVNIGDLKLGEDATVTVTIANATGKVNVIVDGVDNLVDLVDGVATATIQKVTAGTHTVVANYAGDAKNNVAYGSASKTLTVLSTEITDVNVDGDLNINAVLKDSNGKGIENATILYKIGAQNATVTTGANGTFTIKGEENAKVEISYGGSDLLFPTTTVISLSDVAPTRVASNIAASQLTCYAVDTAAGEKGAMFKVTLSDDLGKLANASVQFALNGNIYNATTDENGVASVQVNINKANTYTCAISYLGDIKHDASFTAAKVVVNKKKTTLTAKAKSYKVKTKTKKYTATLKTIKGSSADGKTYLKAGKKVTITVNKKTYTAKTNKKGQVTFKITKLNKKGKYTAVIKFAGDNTYKAANKKVKITVK